MEKMREESVSETQSKARLYFNRGKLDRALKRAVNGARVLITKRWTLSAVPTIRPEISARADILRRPADTGSAEKFYYR